MWELEHFLCDVVMVYIIFPMYLNNIGNDIDALEMCMNVLYELMLHTRIKNIKNVTRCRDSRSTKSIETR